MAFFPVKPSSTTPIGTLPQQSLPAPDARYDEGKVSCGAELGLCDMERSLIWMEGANSGWTCSNCQWKYPVPTLLSGEEALGAYDRLAAAKFREHKCETLASPPLKPQPKTDADTGFANRARALIKRGYKPKVAVELALQEIEMEFGHKPNAMERARVDAEEFLSKVSKGLI